MTVMHIEEGRHRVEGTEGSSSCGGMHIDSLLLSFVMQKMINQGMGYRLKSEVREKNYGFLFLFSDDI